MKFTKGQLRDLETVEYFIPDELKGFVDDEARQRFVLQSERGVKIVNETKGDEALQQGKRWRGIHIQMYEDGILDGCGMGYFTILGCEQGDELIPESVMEYLARTMFKGIDKEVIEKVYYDCVT